MRHKHVSEKAERTANSRVTPLPHGSRRFQVMHNSCGSGFTREGAGTANTKVSASSPARHHPAAPWPWLRSNAMPTSFAGRHPSNRSATSPVHSPSTRRPARGRCGRGCLRLCGTEDGFGLRLGRNRLRLGWFWFRRSSIGHHIVMCHPSVSTRWGDSCTRSGNPGIWQTR